MEKGIEILKPMQYVSTGLYEVERYYLIEDYSGQTAGPGSTLTTETVATKGKIYAFSPVITTGARITFNDALTTPFLLYNDINKKLCVGIIASWVKCAEDIPDNAYKIIDNLEIVTRESYQQTLLYTGKEGDILKFTYREFINDMARPAFNIDVSYDLKDGNTVGFKSAQIQVIKVTNSSITYKVLRTFD